jgi:hypothetical protein
MLGENQRMPEHPDLLQIFIEGGAVSTVPGQLRPEEHGGDNENPYQPDQ